LLYTGSLQKNTWLKQPGFSEEKCQTRMVNYLAGGCIHC